MKSKQKWTTMYFAHIATRRNSVKPASESCTWCFFFIVSCNSLLHIRGNNPLYGENAFLRLLFGMFNEIRRRIGDGCSTR